MNGARTCDVDGCKQRVEWRETPHRLALIVTHGDNREAATEISFDDLFINTGYKAWAQSVHQYEAQRPHNYEVGA